MKKTQSLTFFAIIAALGYWFLTSFTAVQSPISIIVAIFGMLFLQSIISQETGDDFIGYFIQLIGQTAFTLATVFALLAIGLSEALSPVAVFVAYYITPSILGWANEFRPAKA